VFHPDIPPAELAVRDLTPAPAPVADAGLSLAVAPQAARRLAAPAYVSPGVTQLATLTAAPPEPAAARRPAPGVIAGLLAASELGGYGPATPLLPSPADVIAVAFVRRETVSAAATGVAARQQLSAQAVGSGSAFSNRSPTLNPRQTGQSAGGVVSGNLNAVDPDSAPLTFTVTARPTRGTVTVRADGSYTYTANPALAATGTTDSFGVTVSDASSGFHVHGAAGLLNLLSGGRLGSSGHTASATVPVVVAPFGTVNRAPTGTAVVGSPNGVTGVVTGTVTGTDADRDPLTYSAPASTAKGSVGINATAGSFTFTPTAVARHVAALLTATAAQRADTFTVTVSDGRGGTAAVPITVAIAGANVAPVVGVPTVGVPDAGTGRVNGSVSATDADGDTLTYSAPATTAKGAIAINSTAGSFTYTPTAAARQTAAATGATAADRRDVFTVSVTDAHGGTANVAVTVPISPASIPAGPLAAFPGAEGFGASATGGRGGSVVYVTNLNANGPGSLQWAIDQPGARYILFKVSGVIDAQIHLTNGNVTIAGQTSPGGITIRGLVTDETPYQDQAVQPPADFAENWILQHIRIRPGLDGPSDDGLRIRYTRNAIVDHVSIGNATDEAIEISYSHDITIQNTLIAETVGGHSFYGGVLMNYSNPANGFGLDNVSLHHNVFNRIEGRLPEGSRESLAAARSYMNLEMSNNLYWDPNFFVALGLTTNSLTDSSGNPYPIYWNLNAVNNYFRTRTDFPYGMFDDQILRTPLNNLFVSGNKMNLYPTRSDYQLFYCCNDYPAVTDPNTAGQAAHKLSARHPFPAITYTPTDQLVNLLLNTAGAWPRDPMDRRLMSSVATNTIASAPRNTNPAGDALLTAYSGAAPAAPSDTDNDGMPDTWETAKGLNPNVANTNARTLSSAGYTDLDVYLNELSVSRVTGWAG
jgi:VCBS repeat-containing protein